jgi:hypothetical protein
MNSMPELKVKGPLGCHIWMGATNRGYPVMRLDGRVQQVRRVVYERERRQLLAGERVRMACGERLCVLAAHMLAATRSAAR